MKQPLSVWAPASQHVAALVNGEHITMNRDTSRDGWWRTKEEFPAGTLYQFLLDNEGPFPDPRSSYQPEGTTGPSEIIDHSSYQWTDQNFKPTTWKDAVIYELHVGTFTTEGTFESAIPHLDSLVELGITHVELMPVGEFPGDRGWGYDVVGFYAPFHAYGDPASLKQLINSCHERGLAVILDVVYNHIGPADAYMLRFGNYFNDKHKNIWGSSPNLDCEDSYEPRQFFLDNAFLWLKTYHFDGLRIDAADHILDDSRKHLLAELQELVNRFRVETGQEKILIAESASNDRRFVTAIDSGGYGMTAQWCDDFHHSMRTVFTKETYGYYIDFGPLAYVTKALKQAYVYDGKFSVHRNREHGELPVGMKGSSFVGYTQTHDQVGNRALCDRFHQHENVELVDQKIAAAFSLLSQFVPMIFMGEEWSASSPFIYFTHHEDDLGKLICEGRRKEFSHDHVAPDDVPDPQDPASFEKSKLDWRERSAPEKADMLKWYTDLLAIRKTFLSSDPDHLDRVEADNDQNGKWLWMRRGDVWVIASLGKEVVEIPVSISSYDVLLSSGNAVSSCAEKLCFRGKGVIVTRTK